MESQIAIIPVAAAAYVATNLGNFILLAGLLARYRARERAVITAYFSCMLILAFAGYWIGKAADFVPVDYLGLLGIVPITIGAVELARLRRGRATESAPDENLIDAAQKVFAATLFSQLANGADTVAVFGVLFADSTPSADTFIILTLAAMAVTFVLVGIYAVRHPALGDWVERYAARAMPFILILIGIYIFANTATDLLPG